MGKLVQLELSGDEALVLFEYLSRCEDDGSLTFQDQAEERALWSLHGLLEKRLVEVFDPAYKALVKAAQDRLRDSVE